MLTFRQKIIVSYVGLYVLFIAIMFALVSHSVGAVVRRAMGDQAGELISAIQDTGSIRQAIQMLKGRERTYFFRVGLLDSQGRILYDSKARKLFGPAFNPTFETNHPEVEEALVKGVGYSEDYSTLFSQKFAYLAESFAFRDQTYVLRLAFPFRPIEVMTRDFELGFTVLVSLVLLTFALLNWLVINRLTQPVQRVIDAISPYQQGMTDVLPQLPLSGASPSTEVDRLSDTLNRLNQRVQAQIAAVLQERNERSALLETLGEGVLAFDDDGRIAFMNRSARRLLGVPSDMELPRPAAELSCSHRELLDKSVILAERVLKTRSTSVETYERSGGPTQVIELVGSRVQGQKGVLVVLQDMTSQTQVLRIGKDFVANASHELRTPITIIRGFAETLHEHPDLDSDSRTQMTSKIVRNCSRMEVLIQNLLLLADIEHLPEDQQYPFDLSDVVEECIQQIQDIAPEATVSFAQEGAGPFTIRGAGDLVELTVMNLLGNAIKYSRGIPHIQVRLFERPSTIELQVEDNGIGIPEADLPHIFNRFYTVDKARSRRLGGAGLGLAIVKSIVEKHRGTITARSTPDKGTTFTMVFPRAKPEF
jgi:two-component system phosphate regulon sensor histidine kinase PhoR